MSRRRDTAFADIWRDLVVRRSPAFLLGGRGMERTSPPRGPLGAFLQFATRTDRIAHRYFHRRAIRLSFGGEDFAYWNLIGRDLSGVQITKGNLERAHLRDADLASARLYAANLDGADLAHARLWHADLRAASLVAADLSGCDLRGARLESTALRNANLWGADLADARLGATDLRGADLRGAKLGASFDRALVIEDERTRWPDEPTG
jgi:uncharacterized protein YjbI with pentapeptide repeats